MSNEIYKVYKNILFFTAPFCKREFLILNLYKEDECKIEHEFHLKSWKCLNLIFIVLSTIKYFDTVALDLLLIVLIDQKTMALRPLWSKSKPTFLFKTQNSWQIAF